MHRTAHFKTAEPEAWTFDANGEVQVPGGRQLAEKLRDGIAAPARTVSAVEQHSYYGWRFEVALDGVSLACVLNAADDCSFTVEIASLLPAFLLSRRHRQALAECERAFDGLLRGWPEITDVSWA
jgi:hypothetical protein